MAAGAAAATQTHNHLYDDDDQQQQQNSSSSQRPFDLQSSILLGDLTENTPDVAAASNLITPAAASSSGIHCINPGNGNAKDLKYYLPLYKAALKGDWESARRFFKHDPDAVKAKITVHSRTALHVAAGAGHVNFVKELVELMPPEALAMQETSNFGATALHFAVITGIIEAVEAMVRKNSKLTQITHRNGGTPLLVAASYATEKQKDMVWYLCTVTRDETPSPYSGIMGARLVCSIIAAGFFDIALYLIQCHPNLATARDIHGIHMLAVLAQRPFAFPSGSVLHFWQHCIYSFIPLEMDDEPAPHAIIINSGNSPPKTSRDLSIRGVFTKIFSWTYLAKVPGIKHVYQTKLQHIQALQLVKCICEKVSLLSYEEMMDFFVKTPVLRIATMSGIIELVTECLQTFPDQIWFNPKGESIFHIAVEHRREKIFNHHIFGTGALNKLLASWTVESDNNILHIAAKLSPSAQLKSVSGAALQMQRELQWYKEVERIVQPYYKNKKNKNKETPREVFTNEHNNLVVAGEKWMKDTAQSCMVVGTLIATIAFAAAFTVPGGNINDSNNSDNGIPIFLSQNTFKVFIISDALGLFSSSTSVLMFLSILTSRYAEEDFLYSLPRRLIIGLATLFLSIVGMMVAFTAALSIVLGHRLAWASFPIAALACFPVALFALLQFPLLVEIVNSTYGHGIFHVQSKYKVY